MKRSVIVVVIIGIAAALGFVLQRQVRHENGAVSVTAAAAPAASAPPATAAATAAEAKPAGPAVPAVLPQFKLADRDGKMHALAEWKGRPLMVNFWATWCGPCRREIPLLNQLRSEHKAQKLEIVGIAVDFRDDILKYAKENPISYPLLMGEEDGIAAVHAMGVQDPAFPFTVFADSQQRVLTLKFGELHRDEAEMILERLAQVDAGTLELPEARRQITEGLKQLATKRAAAQPATSG